MACVSFICVVLQNVLVNENFVQLLELICQEHPSLEVHYGGVGGFIAKKPSKRVDPMKVIQVNSLHSTWLHFSSLRVSHYVCWIAFLKDYLDQRKLRLWDFFRNIDKDGTMRVPVVDFRKAVQVLTWVWESQIHELNWWVSRVSRAAI